VFPRQATRSGCPAFAVPSRSAILSMPSHMGAGRVPGSMSHSRQTRGAEAFDQGERATVERQDGGALRLHLGCRPGELLGRRVPMGPRGARELALARPAEVRKLEEVGQRRGQRGVDRREGCGVEVLPERTRLVEQQIRKVEARGVAHDLPVGVRAAEVAEPPVDCGVRQGGPLPRRDRLLRARRREVEGLAAAERRPDRADLRPRTRQGPAVTGAGRGQCSRLQLDASRRAGARLS
jgi:hypothetical protein